MSLNVRGGLKMLYHLFFTLILCGKLLYYHLPLYFRGGCAHLLRERVLSKCVYHTFWWYHFKIKVYNSTCIIFSDDINIGVWYIDNST
jgi:hypothetical protein